MSAALVPFTFEDGREIRTVTIDGQPWFVASDLCAILELGNVSMAIQGLARDNISKVDVIDTLGRSRRSFVVNEPGLYQLIFRSKKAEAEKFQNWVYREVLPQIRKTGKFSVDVPFLVPAAQPWTKTFDDEFYKQIFRLKGKSPVPKELAPWLAQATNDLVYRRLPEGVFDALQLVNPTLPDRKHRRKKHHQFVEPTVARRHLDRMLDRCTGMMAGFAGWDEFYPAWNRLYPIERDLPGHLALTFADEQTLLFPFMIDLEAVR